MIAPFSGWARHRTRGALIPLVALLAVSLVVRSAFLTQPCRTPCRGASAHLLVFDEDYYVNAARVIAGVRPPHGEPYAKAPPGDDPNAEHPQLAKLVMAGAIELFGDGPFAWRAGSLLFGTLAVAGMFALVRAAGGERKLALGAAALMAFDNLQLVHGRIATLDVYALAAMLWGAVLYLRNAPVLAGVLIGVGACAKEVAPYALLVLAVLEAFRWSRTRLGLGTSLARLASCAILAGGSFIGLLAVLDRVTPPYADAAHKLIGGGAFAHVAHILHYAAQETSPHGPTGIASYPWEWLFDFKPITYLAINPSRPSARLIHVHPSVHFLGMISPPILLVALAGLIVAGVDINQRAGHRTEAPRADSELAQLGVAWCLGTFVPFELLSLIWSRTSYLYYMVVVLPGLYICAVYLIDRLRPHRWFLLGWAGAVAVAAIIMYPFTPIPL